MINNYLEVPGVNRYLFAQEALSQVFDRVLNTPLYVLNKHVSMCATKLCECRLLLKGYLFFSALGPICQPLGPTKVSPKNQVIFKNKTYIINRRIFPVLLVQGIYST